MARVLHEFQANTKAIASEVNENFAAVQEDINDMGSALDAYFKAELTKAKEDILTDFEEAKTTKLNVDLGNISDEAYNTIYSNLDLKPTFRVQFIAPRSFYKFYVPVIQKIKYPLLQMKQWILKIL